MQADLRGIVTREVEVRSSGDYFLELFACKPDQLAKISPSKVQVCDVKEGEFGKNGSVIFWNYTLDGKACVAKEIIENFDVEKRTVTYRVIEGDVLDSYKTFLFHLHVTPRADNISVVKWSIEYERVNKDVADPTSHVEALVEVSKQANDYLKA